MKLCTDIGIHDRLCKSILLCPWQLLQQISPGTVIYSLRHQKSYLFCLHWVPATHFLTSSWGMVSLGFVMTHVCAIPFSPFTLKKRYFHLFFQTKWHILSMVILSKSLERIQFVDCCLTRESTKLIDSDSLSCTYGTTHPSCSYITTGKAYFQTGILITPALLKCINYVCTVHM